MPPEPFRRHCDWEELKEIYPTNFTLLTMPEHLEHHGDPWAGILDAKQSLSRVLARKAAR